MDKEKIRDILVPILISNGIKKAALFGSIARNEDNDTSDIDILVEADDNTTLPELIGMKMEIESKTNRKADISTYTSLHPRLRNKILKEATVIYEKR